MSRKTTALMLAARAYIDPGTGWIIVTGFLGAATSVVYAVRTFFGRLKRPLSFGGDSGDGDAGSVLPGSEPGAEPDQS